MSLIRGSDLKGILPCVISGGRPTLKQRHTHKLLEALHGVTADPVWIVDDKESATYEPDGHEIVTYSHDWAFEYASTHWTGINPPDYNGFLGCCTGRETACRTAEARGCWAVLQLDDNITQLAVFRGMKSGLSLAKDEGGLGMYADALGAVTLATNGRMVGGFLNSVNPHYKFSTARLGFPYSLFLERVGKGREEWYGPFEADIVHALQYGTSADVGTSLVVNVLQYRKDHTGGGGMRTGYNHERAVPLQRMFPESAKIGVNAAHSNGRGGPRIFHRMNNKSIRTPMVVTDHDLFAKVTKYFATLADEYSARQRVNLRERAAKRAARWA